MGGSVNSRLAEIFYEMADILELKKVRWKPAAYRAAAQTLEELKTSVAEIYNPITVSKRKWTKHFYIGLHRSVYGRKNRS